MNALTKTEAIANFKTNGVFGVGTVQPKKTASYKGGSHFMSYVTIQASSALLRNL